MRTRFPTDGEAGRVIVKDPPELLAKMSSPFTAVYVVVFTEVTQEPPLAGGSTPVTPVVNGRPVALVRTAADGVPSAGVVRVGDVSVLLVRVSVPASVASVPVVGRVTLVVDVVTSVSGSDPDLIRFPESSIVRFPSLTSNVNVLFEVSVEAELRPRANAESVSFTDNVALVIVESANVPERVLDQTSPESSAESAFRNWPLVPTGRRISSVPSWAMISPLVVAGLSAVNVVAVTVPPDPARIIVFGTDEKTGADEKVFMPAIVWSPVVSTTPETSGSKTPSKQSRYACTVVEEGQMLAPAVVEMAVAS